MPLHPQVRAFVEAFDAQFMVDFTTIDAPTFRSIFAMPTPVESGDPVARIEDRLIDGEGGPLRLRIYVPEGEGAWPMTLYFFGSGFVVGSPEQTDHICRALAHRARTLVVSVDYRLAPEAPFPAAVDDALAALRWICRHAAELGGDASRIAVAGDSSGGNLAAVLAQQARHEGLSLRHQLLIYPPLDAAGNTESYRKLATGFGFTAAWMHWYWRQYLADATDAADVRASPLREPALHGLPSATIFTAEYDILRDEAEAYAAAMQAAGVPVELKRWPGQIHGFLLMTGLFDDAELALDEAAVALRRAFA
ncbi:MAG: alpha/beta hydrolase [Rhodanobacter sp.]